MGADYTYKFGAKFWADGDASDKNIVIDIVDDSDVEVDETFNLELQSPTGGAVLGRLNKAVVTIVDDTPPAGIVAFSATDYSVLESGDSVTITATRSGGSTGEVSVTYRTNPHLSTAKAGSDYLENYGTLTWADGDTADKSFTLSTINHNQIRGEKTIGLYLFDPTGGAQLGSPDFAEVTVISTAVEPLDPWPSALWPVSRRVAPCLERPPCDTIRPPGVWMTSA